MTPPMIEIAPRNCRGVKRSDKNMKANRTVIAGELALKAVALEGPIVRIAAKCRERPIKLVKRPAKTKSTRPIKVSGGSWSPVERTPTRIRKTTVPMDMVRNTPLSEVFRIPLRTATPAEPTEKAPRSAKISPIILDLPGRNYLAPDASGLTS